MRCLDDRDILLARCVGGKARLRCIPVVVYKQTSEPFTALHVAFVATDFVARIDDLVAETLVISLTLIMGFYELMDRVE